MSMCSNECVLFDDRGSSVAVGSRDQVTRFLRHHVEDGMYAVEGADINMTYYPIGGVVYPCGGTRDGMRVPPRSREECVRAFDSATTRTPGTLMTNTDEQARRVSDLHEKGAVCVVVRATGGRGVRHPLRRPRSRRDDPHLPARRGRWPVERAAPGDRRRGDEAPRRVRRAVRGAGAAVSDALRLVATVCRFADLIVYSTQPQPPAGHKRQINRLGVRTSTAQRGGRS